MDTESLRTSHKTDLGRKTCTINTGELQDCSASLKVSEFMRLSIKMKFNSEFKRVVKAQSGVEALDGRDHLICCVKHG